jgi:3-oxoacyl-[acyl-carrier protein] reductase
MDTSAATRVAVVTGGSRGIGRSVARRLGQDGLAVVVNYVEDAVAAEETVAVITATGGRAVPVRADIAAENAAAALFDHAEQEFGGVDVVVNCAGLAAASTIANLDLAVLDSMIRTTVRGAFVVAQQAARRLRTGGSFVGFSTSAIGTRFPAYGPYAGEQERRRDDHSDPRPRAARSGRHSERRRPGSTATELFFQGKTDEDIDRLAKTPPLERLGTPEDIARVVTFLVSEQGHWVNGQVLRANAGMV